MLHFLPSDPSLSYMGRIDFSDPNAPVFYWPGSLVQFRFTGKTLRLLIENRSYDAGNGNGLSLGFLLDDGKPQKLALSPENGIVQTVTVAAESDGLHSIRIWKREDGSHSFTLRGIKTEDGAALSKLPLPGRRLEAFGDSVTSGCWVELTERVGNSDYPDYTTAYDNAWYGFAMQTARLLNAQIHLTAQGGIALLDGTGYYEYGAVGMESAYTKLCYQPASGRLSEWDFSRYLPDTVIFAVGQNDQHVGDRDNVIPDAEREAHWLGVYCGIIRDLMQKYPSADFILTLTVLMHDAYWEDLLDKAAAMLDSPRVHRFRFTRTGKATPGHPRIPEQCEMACELTEFILSLDAERASES